MKITRHHFPRIPYARGSALLAVLWIIALLAALVATTALMLIQDVDTLGTRRQIFRSRMLAEMGLAVAANPDVKPDDPILHYEVAPGERYDVDIIGEDGRINPNILIMREDRETLRRIFRAWGMDMMKADALVDAMLDWVDPDDFIRGINGAEARFYRTPGMPFNRQFRSIDEMALVRGMGEVEAAYPQWREWFSIYASGTIDLNEAEPQIISAITGADPMMAQQLRARRLGRDGIPNTKDDALIPDVQSGLRLLGAASANPEATAQILSVTSSTRRILCRGTTGDFSRTIMAVVSGSPQSGGFSQLLALEE